MPAADPAAGPRHLGRALLFAPTLAGLAGLCALASSCGDSPGSQVAQLGSTTTPTPSSPPLTTSAHSAHENKALAFSRCMRSHGVPNFPDPASGGAIPKVALQRLGVSSSQFQSAQSACILLLPNGGQPTQAALQQSWSDFRKFARCMRRRGVPNWPDPTRYPQHPERPSFELQPVGLDPNSPRVSTKIHECEPLLHGNNPQHLGEGGS